MTVKIKWDAPSRFVEIDGNPIPQGADVGMHKMRDGKMLRGAVFPQEGAARGTLVLMTGYSEFIEKYFETIQEFLNKNYSVITFDWRGQGMSDHQLKDIHKAYIKTYERHDQDLQYILEEIIETNFPKPLIGIGHSMGCLLYTSPSPRD